MDITKTSSRYENSHYSVNGNNLNINNIPFAKSYPNMPLNKRISNSNLSSTTGLPPIPRTPYQDEKYKQAYENCNQAKGLIQTRLNKLMYEKKVLGEMKQKFNPYSADYESIYKLRTLGNAKGKLGNPHLYNNQFMDPIYYPLEMPICAEPVTLPKIEIGHPMSKQKCCNQGLGLEDLLALISRFNTPEPVPVYQPPVPIYQPPLPRRDSGMKKKIRHDVQKKVKIPETIKKPPPPRRGLKRDWWRLCRDFCNVYAFFSTGRKYSEFAKVRDNLINSKNKDMIQDIQVLKEWVISITQSFWDEFKVFTDLNVSFKNIDSKLKITSESQKIIAMIRKYLESLINNSTKLQDIPERVQQIIYNYVKDKGYFSKKYLTTYQINRIDYNFYGGTRKLNDAQVGMITAFLIISSVTVQQVLLHMKDNFVEFRNYPNIDITAKYVGSIMHYLTRDTFNNDPVMLKALLPLMNYYRNYHIYNKNVEQQDDIFNNNMTFKDEDEIAEYLVPESSITEFWTLNPEFINTFKNHVYEWATRLGKLIRLKYQKSDKNLLPKRNLERPQDKTADVQIERRTWTEEEKYEQREEYVGGSGEEGEEE